MSHWPAYLLTIKTIKITSFFGGALVVKTMLKERRDDKSLDKFETQAKYDFMNGKITKNEFDAIMALINRNKKNEQIKYLKFYLDFILFYIYIFMRKYLKKL